MKLSYPCWMHGALLMRTGVLVLGNSVSIFSSAAQGFVCACFLCLIPSRKSWFSSKLVTTMKFVGRSKTIKGKGNWEIEKLRNSGSEIEKLRHAETEKFRNRELKKLRNVETEIFRNGEIW